MADGPDCMRGCAGDGWRVRRAFAWLLSRWTAYLSCSRFLAGTRCGSAASPASAEMKNVRQGGTGFQDKKSAGAQFYLGGRGGAAAIPGWAGQIRAVSADRELFMRRAGALFLRVLRHGRGRAAQVFRLLGSGEHLVIRPCGGGQYAADGNDHG